MMLTYYLIENKIQCSLLEFEGHYYRQFLALTFFYWWYSPTAFHLYNGTIKFVAYEKCHTGVGFKPEPSNDGRRHYRSALDVSSLLPYSHKLLITEQKL